MADAASSETLLEVNNIEVIYNRVILVLKGVSLSVPKGVPASNAAVFNLAEKSDVPVT